MADLPADLHCDDLARARRMLDGDEAEFEAFFEETFDGLYRFALRRLDGDETLAQELVQATLCRAFEKLDTFRGEAALFTWLCSLCRSEISHHFRRSAASLITSAGFLGQSSDVLSALDALATLQPDARDHVITQELEMLVHITLDDLPHHYNQALQWKYFEGMAVVDIAHRLEMSAKAAESLLTRSREAFRRTFSDLCHSLDDAAPQLGTSGVGT